MVLSLMQSKTVSDTESKKRMLDIEGKKEKATLLTVTNRTENEKRHKKCLKKRQTSDSDARCIGQSQLQPCYNPICMRSMETLIMNNKNVC